MTNDLMNDDELFNELDVPTKYSISLSTMLRKKLDQHLQILKSLKERESNQKTWIIKAIQEKLSRDDPQDITKGKFLSVLLDINTSNALDERLAEISKTTPNYSKRQWLIDAIEEKLEAEKDTVLNGIEKYRSEFKK